MKKTKPTVHLTPNDEPKVIAHKVIDALTAANHVLEVGQFHLQLGIGIHGMLDLLNVIPEFVHVTVNGKKVI